jgi:hypothetical protein
VNDEVLARVRATFQALDPVPADVLAAARSALTWRVPGAELAEPTANPSSPRSVAGVRGTDAPRTLTFAASRTVIELEIDETGHGCEIAGRLAPPSPAEVRVRHLALVPEQPGARVDQAGHFALPTLPEGLVSLAFLLPDGTSIVTSWIRL